MANLGGGNNSGKLPATTMAAPEKPKFSQTCNLLSQYLKERGSFGDISLGIKGSEASRTPSTTLNLFSNNNNNEHNSEIKASSSTDIKPNDFFPKFLGSCSSNPIEDSNTKSADLRKSSTGEPVTAAQMTIFYAGKVMVFDEFPAEKAKEIFDLATKGRNPDSTTTTATNGFVATVSGSPIDKSKSTSSAAAPLPPPVSNNAAGDKIPLRHEDRIARRASLHRFFEKRKDRAAAKAPYQVNKPSSPPPRRPPQQPKPANDERHEWIDLEAGQTSKQFDLNM